jgi:hypothetical protein
MKESSMNRIRSEIEKQRGQSLVEFAVSAIVILLLLVGIADFGRAFFTYLAMRDAAQEGASYGSICPRHYSQIIDRVLYTGNSPVNLADASTIRVECYFWLDEDEDGIMDVGESFACNGGYIPVPGTGIQIRVIQDDFVITTPLLGSIIGQSISLRAEVTDTILRVVNPAVQPVCP